mmetsp:Transcript_3929/g.14414  ORF Transcript_3929/g.14414 Transcript_3929/m.14414 type:complete len:302 (-) Transcript_3929:626-1531(-)
MSIRCSHLGFGQKPRKASRRKSDCPNLSFSAFNEFVVQHVLNNAKVTRSAPPGPSASQARPTSPNFGQCASSKCRKGRLKRASANCATASSSTPTHPVRSSLSRSRQYRAMAFMPARPHREQSRSTRCLSRRAPLATATTAPSPTQSPQQASESFCRFALTAQICPRPSAVNLGQPARLRALSVERPCEARAFKDRSPTWKQPSKCSVCSAVASRERARRPSKPKPRSAPSVSKCIAAQSKNSSLAPNALPKTRTPTSVTRRAPCKSTLRSAWQWSAKARQPAFVTLTQPRRFKISRVAPA